VHSRTVWCAPST